MSNYGHLDKIIGENSWMQNLTILLNKLSPLYQNYVNISNTIGNNIFIVCLNKWGIYNIRTLSVNIKFICTSFRNRQNSEPLASFSGLFRSEYKWILYLTTMYVYCVYPAMSKKSENLSDLNKKEFKIVILLFLDLFLTKENISFWFAVL